MSAPHSHRSARSKRFVSLAVFIICLALTAVIVMSLTGMGIDIVGIQTQPAATHFDYCLKDSQQQRLPLGVQKEFADWCAEQTVPAP